MVVFICGSCNDSLKKSIVATHLVRCKPASISCCDCSKEFSDDSYTRHNQCISEDAKYGPESQRSLYAKDKGAKKQEDWTNAIRETLKERNISGRAEMVLNKLLEHANIPRIRNKFVNFLSNCSVKVSPDIIEEVWSICEAAIKKMKETHAHQQTPDVKAKPVAQVTETPKDGKKKKKLKQSEGEEVESGETTLTESSEGPDQGESQVEGGDQPNGSDVITKQSKKKKKQSKESESKEEGEEKENKKADEEMTESNCDDKSAETNEVDNDVKNDEENSEPKSDDLKKKSKKKKKRNHSEIEENQEKSSDPKEEDELNEVSHENECDPKKKKIADEMEKEKETTTTSDTPMDQDADQMNGNSNEEEPESQSINWFKQLKRQIKEKETVEMKDFKKMIKKLRKSHNLTEDVSQLTIKARVKLMKRHNYCVADGQIKYTHLF